MSQLFKAVAIAMFATLVQAEANQQTCRIIEPPLNSGCKTDKDCRGNRTCNLIAECVGESGCDAYFRTCTIDERFNVDGPGKCTNNSQCRGLR